RDGAGKAVHQAGYGGAFLRHGDEEFAGAAVAVEADGDVALVSADVEFVRNGHALIFKAMAHGARRGEHVFFRNSGRDAGRARLLRESSFRSGGGERLRLLASVAIDGD